jgi:hypothetical protein
MTPGKQEHECSKLPHRPMLSERVRTGKRGLIGPATRNIARREARNTQSGKSRDRLRNGTGDFQTTSENYFALYSLAVNSLWPTDCACLTVPLGAFASSGHHR